MPNFFSSQLRRKAVKFLSLGSHAEQQGSFAKRGRDPVRVIGWLMTALFVANLTDLRCHVPSAPRVSLHKRERCGINSQPITSRRSAESLDISFIGSVEVVSIAALEPKILVYAPKKAERFFVRVPLSLQLV